MSFVPTCRPVRPKTLTVAAESRVTAEMFTKDVLDGTSMVWPSETSTSFKVRLVKAVSADAPPTRTTNS